MSKLEIYQREDGLWAWRLVHQNGEILATDGGQGYENRSDCATVAARVVTGLYAPQGLAL